MLIFHEGLPGSGKSYCAMTDHIIPALQAGRGVLAYIEGLNHEQIAEVAGIELEKCRELLRSITREEVLQLPSMDYANKLVVIDELQNFWPQSRQALSPEVIQFVAEHRRNGADILAMGQVLNDCHTVWKRRVARKYHFIQKDVIGKSDEYKCIIYKGVPDTRRGDIKFEEVSREDGKYDDRIFGCYASHNEDVTNKQTLKDDRAIIWNNPIFRRWIPIFAFGFLLALGGLIYLFKGGGLSNAPATKTPERAAGAATGGINPGAAQAPPAGNRNLASGGSGPAWSSARATSQPLEGHDLVRWLNERGTPRLVGVIQQRGKPVAEGRIEWVGDKNSKLATLSFSDITGMGWSVFVNTSGTVAILRNGDRSITATANLAHAQMAGLFAK